MRHTPHESVATFCEFEYICKLRDTQELESTYMASLPPYYRRVLSEIQPVMGAELIRIPSSTQIQRATLPDEFQVSHRQGLARLMDLWRSEAARQIGILALEVDLFNIFGALSLRNRHRIRLKFLRHAHSPTRRLRSILRALRTSVRLAELYNLFFLEFEQLVHAAIKESDTEMRGFRPSVRQGFSTDIAKILGLRLPIVVSGPTQIRALFRRVGALFPKCSSDRDWWEQELPVDVDKGEYFLELASQDTAIVPKPWVGRTLSRDETTHLVEDQIVNVLLTKSAVVRGSSEMGTLMAILRTMDTKSGRREDHCVIPLSEERMWRLIGSLVPRRTNLVIDLGVFRATVDPKRFEALYQSVKYTTLVCGIASRSWLKKACEDLETAFPGRIALIPYVQIAPDATVLILGHVGGNFPLAWTVVGSRLLENLKDYQVTWAASADAVLARQIKFEGRRIAKAAVHIFGETPGGSVR